MPSQACTYGFDQWRSSTDQAVRLRHFSMNSVAAEALRYLPPLFAEWNPESQGGQTLMISMVGVRRFALFLRCRCA